MSHNGNKPQNESKTKNLRELSEVKADNLAAVSGGYWICEGCCWGFCIPCCCINCGGHE